MFAAIIVEPIAGNMGVITPQTGFLEGLRELATEHGTLLIFDEVITGFRISMGGAQEKLGIKPDLTCLGKIIGGGLPVGAFGGRREIMEKLAPLGPVYQAGTLSGNPVAMAAGIKTLKLLREPEVFEKLEYRTQYLNEELKKASEEIGVPMTFNRVGSMMTLFFAEGPIKNYDDAKKSKLDLFAKYFQGMLEAGIYLPPSQFEAWFLSLAHTVDDLDRTIEAHRKVLKKL
jgi:glutamate-1-semialdehyde 2,1-aminomutase